MEAVSLVLGDASLAERLGDEGRARALAELDLAASAARIDELYRSVLDENEMTEPRRHLGGGAALSVFVQGGPLIAGGALSIVLARTIGPSGTGHFALLLTLTSIAGMFVSLGLTAGITYEVSRRHWSVREVFRTSYLAALVLGLIGLPGRLGGIRAHAELGLRGGRHRSDGGRTGQPPAAARLPVR